MFITGPDVIKTVTGETVSQEELGGAHAHNVKSGVAHYQASDEQDCLAFTRELLPREIHLRCVRENEKAWRWYEREGLFPRGERDSSRRRRYSPRDVALLRTLARLRRTGMPTREMREFTRLVTEGAATHHQRLALLAAHRERIVARLTELQGDMAVLEKKIEHYRYLIEQGLDCDTP